MGEGEGAMVDKGYVGVKSDYPGVPIVIPFKAARNRPLNEGQRAFNQRVARHRIVVEHATAQLDRFTVLRQCFAGRSGTATVRYSGWWQRCSTEGWRLSR